ncbi:MAG TPA: hypothetical protein VK131_08890, partial [Candidatus Acidoferrales bacterium]|nr:hypothetical protein [Candidatus Acidoferrales bacterium]
MVDRFLPEPPRPGAGLALGLAAIAVFGLLWFQVLTGERTLIATDTLYTVLPWSAEYGARTPANRLLGDEMLEIVPWQQQVAAAFRSGRLPLWNQHAGFGSPLLANGASAPFSPFTWAALPFEPVRGLSLAMLLKLLVAGLGMAAYQRALGGGGLAAALAAVAYATCSSMVVWLAWPIAGVAAFLPWALAAVEWYLRARPALGPAAVALASALLLLAGHAETSLQAGLAVALYSLVRVAASRRWRLFGGLALAAVTGALLAGVQVLPVADAVLSGGAQAAAGDRLGSAHLGWTALSSWLAPNLRGNPALDGSLGGSPNYSEATGFVGVGSLVLAGLGARELWRRDRPAAAALLSLGLVSAAIVYG